MLAFFSTRVNLRFFIILVVLGILSLSIIAPVSPSSIESPGDYPPDPGSDLAWPSGSYNGVADIQTAFNNGRANEGGSLPTMALPSQAVWDSMSDNEKALWLVNNERQARGVQSLHGYESNVTGVALNYANWLLTNDKWGHDADGKSPGIRLGENQKINGCHDDSLWMENLYAFGKSSGTIPLPIERAIYGWMYNDSGSGWLHRRMILHYPCQ